MAFAQKNLLGDLSSLRSHGLAVEEGDGSEKVSRIVKSIGMMMSNTSSPRSENSQYSEDRIHHRSLVHFIKHGYDHFMHANAANNLLSFEQNETNNKEDDDGYSMWEEGNLNHQINQRYNNNSDPRLVEDFNCFDTASNYRFLIDRTARETSHGDWLYTEATAVHDTILESGSSQDAAAGNSLKRPNMDESMQSVKKPCTTTRAATSKKPNNKQKTLAQSSKDPQSIAAKNRRERISERLKILQELVPNGSKVDLVTMLEKAISYVKFLQLQVKVLATDEFWPVQGGNKAPDISQVREAIDGILSSSQRSSTSK